MAKKRITLRNSTENNKKEKSFSLDFQQAYEFFLSAKKAEGLRDKTLISYGEHFRFFQRWREESYPSVTRVDELTPNIIREYIQYMKEDHFNFKTKEFGLSDQTANARLRFLKTLYSFLNKEDLESENPAIKVKFIKMDERPFEPLTDDEMQRLLNVPNKNHYPQWRDYIIMNLLYDSSMRILEAISLSIDDLDIKGRRIILNAGKTKLRKSRIIPLSNHTLKLLLELITENQTHFPDEKSLFLNWYGEPMSEDTFRRNLKRYVKKAGISKNFSCHDFRRQSITEMLRNGASIWSVMSIAGHSQISTTKKYVHFDEQTIKNQHEIYSPVVKMRKNRKGRLR
jgi:integrase/recombinase XerD